jgi:hypothetical protein
MASNARTSTFLHIYGNATVTIPVAEAADIEAKPKPFTPRWLSRLN